ncbi:ZIP family metal transporter [Radiobacillus sp. PE A8.2]|uniref:ZIP family metal transporter n=1 Tax=Radiobacillus sp. PE A8.2 TaxID=3380349 RepID=UPI00388D6218
MFVLLGLIIGGTLGGVINKVVKQVNKLYVYAGSVILSLIILEIIPETVVSYNWIGLTISFLLGIVVMQEVHLLTESFKNYSKTNSLSFGAIFLVIAISIHNIPTGIAISSNWTNQGTTSNELILPFIIHQIPEGLALFLSLVGAGSAIYSTYSFISFTFLIVLCFFLALILGEQSLFQDYRLRTIFMGISIGSLGYVSVLELIIKPSRTLKLTQFIQVLVLGTATVLYLCSS